MNFIPYGLHTIDEEDIEEVVKVLKSNWITTGPKIKEFEDALCKYIRCKYAAAVSSGTAALELAVKSLDIPEGSEIITTPFTFVATSNSIIYNNCNPVFADVKKDTFNLNPEEVRKKITNKTKAIIYVDYAGQPCDIEEMREIAKEHSLFLIEDACHALGAEYKNKKIGNFADLTIFSFHPVKHVTMGEGGVITTDNEELYKRLLMLRNHGIDKGTKERFGPNSGWAYDMKFLGRNYRITDFQCALGLSQLKKLDKFIEKRQNIAERYNRELSKIEEISTPSIKRNIKHAWHIYPILLSRNIDRDKFFNKMRKKNIGVNVHYIPCYKHSYYRENFNFDEKEFPATEDVFKRIITLPLFPKLTEEQFNYIISSIKQTIEELR